MAYNPFNWFRKHQKTIFAFLTLMIMFVFIFQSGSGDLFSQAMKYFGQSQQSGQEVATLNGRRVTEGELSKLAAQRKMASDFLVATIAREQGPALDGLLNKKLKPADGKENPLFGLDRIANDLMLSRRQRESIITQMRQGGSNPQMMQFIQMQMEQLASRSRDAAVQALSDPETGLVAIARRDKVKDDPESLETLMQVGALVGFDLWSLSPREDFYLGGNKQIDSLLDFLLWQQQADKMGITLTDADLAKEISREAGGAELFDPSRVSLDRDGKVTDFLMASKREYGPITGSDVVKALREEYRVALAQSLLLGFEPGGRVWRSLVGGSVSPSVGTPDEFLKFYRDFRTTLRVKLMPVKVEAFLGQVTAEPKEDELRKLFDRHKDQEPGPASRTPGFKEPRRVRAEYVIGSVESPYFRDHGRLRAEYLAELSEPWRRAKVVLNAPALSPLGAGPLGWALAVAGPVVEDPVQTEYETYLKTTEAWAYPDFGGFQKEGSLQLSSVLKPGAVAATVADLGGPLAQVATLYGVGTVNEQRGSIKLTAARVLGLAPAGASAGLDSLLTSVALAAPFRPDVLPVEYLRPTIVAAQQQRLAREHLAAVMADLREELAKLKGKSDASAELVQKRAKESHLSFHRMPRAVSASVLTDATKTASGDLGLGPFKDGINRLMGRAFTFAEVAQVLFADQGTYALGRNNVIPSETEEMLFWRSEDLPAKLRSFAEARDDVAAAWKLEQARDLARRKAVEIRDRINKDKPTPADAARLLAESKAGEIFELDAVAQFIPPKEVRPEARTEYRRYEVPEALEGKLPYPPADLPKLLLEAKRAGDALVFLDRPGRTFYVAVLEARDEPSVSDFKKLYERSPFRDPLYDRFVRDKQVEYARAMVEQLRKEAGAKLDKEGRYELPEGVR
ncbi:MAG: hypothetical protein ACRC33_24940, partial [Gemmataceae bacterium]